MLTTYIMSTRRYKKYFHNKSRCFSSRLNHYLLWMSGNLCCDLLVRILMCFVNGQSAITKKDLVLLTSNFDEALDEWNNVLRNPGCDSYCILWTASRNSLVDDAGNNEVWHQFGLWGIELSWKRLLSPVSGSGGGFGVWGWELSGSVGQPKKKVRIMTGRAWSVLVTKNFTHNLFLNLRFLS